MMAAPLGPGSDDMRASLPARCRATLARGLVRQAAQNRVLGAQRDVETGARIGLTSGRGRAEHPVRAGNDDRRPAPSHDDARGGTMTRTLHSGLALLALAAAALAPALAAAQTKPLKIGMPTSPPNIVHMSIYIAQDAGLFAAEGLKPEILAFEDGTKAFRAMMSNDVDAASGAGGSTIVARSRGAKTKMILALAPKLEATMVVQPEIKSLQDLKGKRIGVQVPGGFAWILSMTVLRSAGLGEKDVRFVSILSEDVPPLVAGQIDTAILHVEQALVAQKQKPSLHILAKLWEVEPLQLYNVLAVQEKTIAERRDEMVRMTKAIIRATRLMYEDKAKVLPIIVKHTGLEAAIISPAFDVIAGSCVWDGEHGLARERVDYTSQRMERVGNIDKGKAPSYEENVDLSIAEAAIRSLGPWKGPKCPSTS
jgi:NitT/TauT family transport system substrate-binding protein